MPKKRLLAEIVECKECGALDMPLKTCPHCEKPVCEECWEDHIAFCAPDDAVTASPWDKDIPVADDDEDEDESDDTESFGEDEDGEDKDFLGNFNLERE